MHMSYSSKEHPFDCRLQEAIPISLYTKIKFVGTQTRCTHSQKQKWNADSMHPFAFSSLGFPSYELLHHVGYNRGREKRILHEEIIISHVKKRYTEGRHIGNVVYSVPSPRRQIHNISSFKHNFICLHKVKLCAVWV
jgi:hypothetical protein